MIHLNNSPSRNPRSAFTLIELIIVIVIIAILAAMSFPVGGFMIKRARKIAAANTASQLGQAVIAYDMHYDRYPITDSGSGSGDVGPLESNGELMGALLARSDLNPDGEVFFGGKRVKDTEKPKNGIAFENVGEPPALLDPWIQTGEKQAKPYRVWIDADRDGKIQDPLSGRTLRLPVLVMSAGPDGEWGGGSDRASKDNVKSW